MKRLAIVALVLMAGCATEPPPAPTVVDTFCLSVEKRSWSTSDTAKTIHDAEVWNATIDRKCGVAGKTASRSS